MQVFRVSYTTSTYKLMTNVPTHAHGYLVAFFVPFLLVYIGQVKYIYIYITPHRTGKVYSYV